MVQPPDFNFKYLKELTLGALETFRLFADGFAAFRINY